MKRRNFIATCAASALAGASASPGSASAAFDGTRTPRPVIDITDLYHPHQDRGDYFDLVAAYGLPQVDLRAVIFDVTERFRRPFTDPSGYHESTGPREPGFIPVQQLDTLYDRAVPCACAPFETMRSPHDTMEDAPAFQQAGIDLMFDVLRKSETPVDIVSFGSARPAAVAYNRNPHLLRRKVRRIHLCAGTAPRGYLEWNVNLDVHAFVRLLRSDLPIAIYPCATPDGPFDLGPHNCYWSMPDLGFIRTMAPPLQRYIEYAFTRSARHDFLTVLREPEPIADMAEHYDHPHHIWETAVWMNVADLRLVQRANGTAAIVPASDVTPDDEGVPQMLRPVHIDVGDDGQFDFSPTSEPTNFLLFDRGNAAAQQEALREAFPGWYCALGNRIPS